MMSKKHLFLSMTWAALAANLWAFAPDEQDYIKIKNKLDFNIKILCGTKHSILGPNKTWHPRKNRCPGSDVTIEIHPTVRASNHHRLGPRSFTFHIRQEGSYTVKYMKHTIEVLDQNKFSSMEI